MTPLDRLVTAVLAKVRGSGMLESNALMGTVSAVGTDGTVTVTRVGDTFPKCRLLSGYTMPAVGDTVEILRTAGGWVCLGAMQSSDPVSGQVVDQRAGSNSITPVVGAMTYKTISFPAMRGDTFSGQLTVSSSVIGTTINGWSVDNVTATSIRVGLDRDNTTTTNFNWLALGIAN